MIFEILVPVNSSRYLSITHIVYLLNRSNFAIFSIIQRCKTVTILLFEIAIIILGAVRFYIIAFTRQQPGEYWALIVVSKVCIETSEMIAWPKAEPGLTVPTI